jgi:hypothetical protein
MTHDSRTIKLDLKQASNEEKKEYALTKSRVVLAPLDLNYAKAELEAQDRE